MASDKEIEALASRWELDAIHWQEQVDSAQSPELSAVWTARILLTRRYISDLRKLLPPKLSPKEQSQKDVIK